MKITHLKVSNFLKLKDIEITPDKTNIIVGKNRQGKTSVLKAIVAAFDGKVDESVIRDGENKAEIIISLEDLNIKRTITEKGNYLDLSNDKGFKIPSPQKYIDQIIGIFSFNPIAFFEMKPLERKKYLLQAIKITITQEELAKYIGDKLTGIDFDKHALEVIEDARKWYYDRRTLANSEVAKKRKTLEELTSKIPSDFDPKSVSEEHIAELRKAIQEDEKIQIKQIEHEKFLTGLQKQEEELKDDIKKLKMQLIEKETKLLDVQKEIAAAAEFSYDVSDPTTIEVAKETLAKLESQRELVFSHKRTEELREELDTLIKEAETLDTIVKKLTKEIPQDLIAKAKLPVKDLIIKDDDILIGNISLDNLSSSEQLKFALDIVKKINNTFKIINIDGIETLDKDNFEIFLKEIENDEFQYFITKVDGDTALKNGYKIIEIENGEIKK